MEIQVDNIEYLNLFIKPLKDSQIMIPDIGPAILLDELNESLFCNKDIDYPRIDLLRNGFSIRYNDKKYFIVSELSRYIKFLSTNFDKLNKPYDYEFHNMCPINYYLLNNTMEFKNNILFEQLYNFKKYLEVNSFDKLVDIYWPNFFKGVITSFISLPYMMVLLFKRNDGKSLTLNIIKINNKIILLSSKYTSYILDLPKDKPINDEQLYDMIIEDWTETINMDNEKVFIINNLTNVIGSLDMATFIFESKEQKDKYIININDINTIINFSSNKSIKKYIEYFCLKYPKLYNTIDKNTFVNFEGFNKYLLNLDPEYLKSFNDKELINEMYYNITNELINSYEKLYYFTK